jgi:hypothetical protein
LEVEWIAVQDGLVGRTQTVDVFCGLLSRHPVISGSHAQDQADQQAAVFKMHRFSHIQSINNTVKMRRLRSPDNIKRPAVTSIARK